MKDIGITILQKGLYEQVKSRKCVYWLVKIKQTNKTKRFSYYLHINIENVTCHKLYYFIFKNRMSQMSAIKIFSTTDYIYKKTKPKLYRMENKKM